MSDGPVENTDRELWREREGDYYADSIHVTADGRIGINHHGLVVVATLQQWHALARPADQPPDVYYCSAEGIKRASDPTSQPSVRLCACPPSACAETDGGIGPGEQCRRIADHTSQPSGCPECRADAVWLKVNGHGVGCSRASDPTSITSDAPALPSS